MRSNLYDLSKLPWTTSPAEFVVYRGQSGSPASKPGIKRVGTVPHQISTEFGKPISTSRVLSKIVLGYAVPEGRVFKIHVMPGIRYVSIKDTVGEKLADPALFQFLSDELQAGDNKYKTWSLNRLQGVFNDIVNKEDEVLLDLSNAEFRNADDKPETWVGPLDTPYETYLVPKTAGGRRGRTFRRKAKRMNKNGHRPPRQSLRRRNRNT